MTTHQPVSPLPRTPRQEQGHRAGLVSRLAAGVLDLGGVLALLSIGYAGANAVLFLARPRTFEPLVAPRWVLLALAGAIGGGYLAASWWLTGRTYGYQIMGLRVVDRRGRSPHLAVAVLRAVLYVVLPIGVLWCAVSGSRRSVQDLVVRTYVIYDWAHRSSPVEVVAQQVEDLPAPEA